jgi:hypothetical protein
MRVIWEISHEKRRREGRSMKLAATVQRRPSPMPKSKFRRKKTPKRVLALSDLEQTKTAVLNSLTSGQRPADLRQRHSRIRRLVLFGRALRSTGLSCSGIEFTSNSAGMRLPRSTFGSLRFVAWRTRQPTLAS